MIFKQIDFLNKKYLLSRRESFFKIFFHMIKSLENVEKNDIKLCKNKFKKRLLFLKELVVTFKSIILYTK